MVFFNFKFFDPLLGASKNYETSNWNMPSVKSKRTIPSGLNGFAGLVSQSE